MREAKSSAVKLEKFSGMVREKASVQLSNTPLAMPRIPSRRVMAVASSSQKIAQPSAYVIPYSLYSAPSHPVNASGSIVVTLSGMVIDSR